MRYLKNWINKRLALALASLLLPTLGNAKIYCCIPFCNEYEILKIHLDELYDYVDHFVIAESCETFRGNSKPYNFENHRELYRKYLDKIIYIKIGPQRVNDVDPFTREHWQREHILKSLSHLQKEDIIIQADCDEILDHRAVQKLPTILLSRSIVAFKQRIFFFFLNYSCYYTEWVGPTATTMDYLRKHKMTYQELRQQRTNSKITSDYYGGWHFSSAGGFETAYYKATNWSHWADANNPHVNSINRWKEIGNMSLPGAHLVEMDDTFPRYVLEHKEELIKKGLIFADYETSIRPTIDLYEN